MQKVKKLILLVVIVFQVFSSIKTAFSEGATYIVTFDSQGGNVMESVVAQAGFCIDPPDNPILSGYYFDGWYKEAECTSAWDFNANTVIKDTTLYAKWTRNGTLFSGSGTLDDPYGISSPAQLNAVRNYLGAHFILLNDIDMTLETGEGGAYWNNGKGWTPIGNTNEPFIGNFNGNAHAIRGLFVNVNSQDIDRVGLFGYLKQGKISSLGLEDSYISAQSACALGGIVGRVENATVTGCYNTSRIVGGTRTGGIVGFSNNGTIIGCYNTGRISSSYYNDGMAGGIAGWVWAGKVEDCYNVGSVGCGVWAGGIAGYITDVSGYAVKNCYNVGKISSGQYAGGISGYAWYGFLVNCYYLNNMSKGVGNGIDQSVSVTIPQMTLQTTFSSFDFGSGWTMEGHADYLYPELRGKDMVVRPVSHDFAGGNGTSYNPYQIGTKEQFNRVRNHPNADFVLINNIEFTESDFSEGGAFYNGGAGFVPFGTESTPFSGMLDGNGYSVIGLYQHISGSSHISYGGLCGYTNFSTIQNLDLKECSISISTLGSSSYAGGIAGYMNEGLIIGCNVAGNIGGEPVADIGGIAGSTNRGEICRCRNEAIISGSHSTGGIAGSISITKINDCKNLSSISGGDYVGGIVGSDGYRGEVSNCINLGKVTGRSRIGGIIGSISYGTVTNCQNEAYITGDHEGFYYSGGIVGYANLGFIKYCRNLGNVNCSLEGYAGGIAGETGGTTETCYNSGDISGGAFVGGIVGFIHNNTADLYFKNWLYDCYNTGSISGNDSYSYAGGMAGLVISGTVHTCYNTGGTSVAKPSGGILGRMVAGTVENCYYVNKTPKGVGDGTDTAVAVTYDQLRKKETFTGFDFDTIWTMDGNQTYAFPELQSVPITGTFVTSITVTSSNDTVMEGQTLQMNVSSVLPETADDKSYTWSVVNGTGEASTDVNGLLTAIKAGKGNSQSYRQRLAAVFSVIRKFPLHISLLPVYH